MRQTARPPPPRSRHADEHDITVGLQYRASASFEVSPQADADRPAHMAGREPGRQPAVERHHPSGLT
jgi:hypothetical protein